MVRFCGQQLTVSDFVDIHSLIPILSKCDANEHLKKTVEMDGEKARR
jgi:hypothetical protein